MPDSFQAIAVAILALFPGALYLLSFERTVGGHWGVNLADRVTRFLVISALYHVVLAPLTFQMYRQYVVTAPVRDASHLPWTLWIALLLYLGVPCAFGVAVGAGVNSGYAWVRPFAGRAPQPRAWDYLWGAKPEVTVRLRLKTGSWVAGIYGETPDGQRRAGREEERLERWQDPQVGRPDGAPHLPSLLRSDITYIIGAQRVGVVP